MRSAALVPSGCGNASQTPSALLLVKLAAYRKSDMPPSHPQWKLPWQKPVLAELITWQGILCGTVKHFAFPAQANAAEEDEPEDETTAAFRRAAAALKEKREEEAMCVEDRIYKCASKP